ncbi:MAG TPA: DUF2752 domain-containing protein [Candidatus Ozemobacteraceae bacterium]|nr:DUF2752 domain-containing protein [Candidatus Ozemobacteraceae bacterium]
MRSDPVTAEARFHAYQRHQLVVAVLIVLAALILTPAPPGGELVSLLGREIPALCPHQLLFQAKCPGCGLVRSFTAFAHGRIGEAAAFHRLGILLFLVVAAQIPLRAWLLRKGPAGLTPPVAAFLHWSGPALIGSLILSWVGERFGWF